MLDVTMYQVVLLIGIVSGLAVRTGFYFYAKQKEDQATGEDGRPFEAKYLLTAGIAGVMIFTGALLAYPMVEAAVPNEAGSTLMSILSASFIMAIGLNEVFNRLLTLIGTTPILVMKAEEELVEENELKKL